ncbi:MAG: potassium channel protein [Deltaproteobacteria bacterium]|nr:potassium channel protein [Deltaproteobacteria bacterium]MBW2218962.1 potassium channel protein [Deltaproteobacteria bacterium]
MNSSKNLLILIFLSILFVAFGTAGYMWIEKWDLLDAVYMTVITLTTVGFGEVHETSHNGRLFTIFLILFGAGFCLYVAGAFVQFMVEGKIRTILGRKRLDKKIDRLKNHYIVCGYGRIGRVLCNKLREKKHLDVVVIESNADLIPVMDEDDVLYIRENASDETSLIKAGIERAKALIAVLATDTDNVFLVLTARQLNPDIFIMARSGSRESKSKLRTAGANQVESPYDTGATSMANRLLRPTVTNFLDLAFAYKNKDIQMEEIPVDSSSDMANKMLKDSGIRQKYDLIIIAMKKKDGSMLFNPSFETIIEPGDTVIAVGEEQNLLGLEQELSHQIL